ncbi:hypothetical protein ACFL2V_15050 [Pseudomonadota bacterium]
MQHFQTLTDEEKALIAENLKALEGIAENELVMVVNPFALLDIKRLAFLADTSRGYSGKPEDPEKSIRFHAVLGAYRTLVQPQPYDKKFNPVPNRIGTVCELTMAVIETLPRYFTHLTISGQDMVFALKPESSLYIGQGDILSGLWKHDLTDDQRVSFRHRVEAYNVLFGPEGTFWQELQD